AAGWPEEGDPSLPLLNVKFKPGMSLYLVRDNKDIASRRARLRFDRSGLGASLAKRRLVASADCPDCKGVTDDAEHALLQCPRFAVPRQACAAALDGAGCALDLGI